MRILLVDPPFHAFMKYDRWHFPASLAQLAAVAHEDGHEVLIYDADKYFPKDLATRDRNYMIKQQSLYTDNVNNTDHYIWQHFEQFLSEYKPDVIGVSVYTSKLQSVLQTLEIVRRIDPTIKTCIGGAHVTAVPQTFADNLNVDAIFVGYADLSFPKWLKDGMPKGIINGDIAAAEGFETLPYNRRQALLKPELYNGRDLSHLMTSRGCVARCNFCSTTFMSPKKPKFRTSESIRTEVSEMISEWNVEKISVGDSSFSDIQTDTRRIASVLKEFGLPWSCNIRFGSLKQDLLEYYQECGCEDIFLGLESGSDKVLKHIRKGCTRKSIRKGAEILNSIGIDWQLGCVTGFPVETLDDMQQTLDLALEINPTSISLNCLSPLPGTDVYNGIEGITPEIASDVGQLNPNKCFSPHMTLTEFQDMFGHMNMVFEKHNKKSRSTCDIA